jgi:metal-responsive CopG/Arc/MetJ family transcriptional regulator
MATRISARLEEGLVEKLEAIRRRTGMTTREIVEAALIAWTEQEARTSAPARAFEAAGSIASGRGAPDLARTARAKLARSLAKKS